jgi:hypothetical protein
MFPSISSPCNFLKVEVTRKNKFFIDTICLFFVGQNLLIYIHGTKNGNFVF